MASIVHEGKKKKRGEKEHHGWRSGEEDGRVIGDFLFLYL